MIHAHAYSAPAPAGASPAAPSAPRIETGADEFRRIRSETHALSALAVKEIAARALERVRMLAPRGAPDVQDAQDAQERAALLDGMRQELRDAMDAMAAGGRGAARAQHRLACDALHLFRICPRKTCRKAQACRGNPVGCYQRARVPGPVSDWVARLLLADLAPWFPMLGASHAQERRAYECWIAGIDARRR